MRLKIKLSLIVLVTLLLSLFFSCTLSSESNKKDMTNSAIIQAFGTEITVSRNSNSSLRTNQGKRPFPQNVGLPSSFTQPQGDLEGDLRKYYEMWANIRINPLTNNLDGYLMRDSYNKEGKKYTIVRADATGAGTGTPSLSSQSEAHGFGMIILALMEDNDDTNINEHKEFDSMFNLSRKFLWEDSDGEKTNLMHWEIPPEGTVNNEGPATDGDVTIAYALLLADKQWGTGLDDNGNEIYYLDEAKKILTDIKNYQINDKEAPGNPWTTLGHNGWLLNTSRPSDWMIDVYMDFFKATGDDVFKKVAENIVRNINTLQTNYAPNTGLVPDFVDNKSGVMKPATNTLTGPIGTDELNEGDFSYNACRVPYRLARAAALYPDMNVDGISIQQLASKINNWYINKYHNPIKRNDDPVNYPTTTGWEGIGLAGLTLAGNAIDIEWDEINPEEDPGFVFWSDNCFNSSFATSLLLSGNQDYINKMYTLTNNFDGWGPHNPGKDEYYGYFADTITLLSKIIISGNWWNPSEELPGQVLVSKNKPVFSSSSIPGFEKENINDDDVSTIFKAQKSLEEPWVFIDLGKNYLLSEIDILWTESGHANNYSLGICKYGTTDWQLFNINSTGLTDTFSGLASAGIEIGYIGLIFNEGLSDYYGIKELKVYATHDSTFKMEIS